MIRPESAAESRATTALCRTSVVSSRARASSLVTDGLERPTAPMHALGMAPEMHQNGQRPDAAGSRLLKPIARLWAPCGNRAHGHMRGAGRSHDSAREGGPPVSILDSRTGVKVNVTSTKPYPSRVRVTRLPNSTRPREFPARPRTHSHRSVPPPRSGSIPQNTRSCPLRSISLIRDLAASMIEESRRARPGHDKLADDSRPPQIIQPRHDVGVGPRNFLRQG